MVFLVAIASALSLGTGWVLQQRVAAKAALSELLPFRLLWHLMHQRVWWGGIAAMVLGAVLGAFALQLGSVALVEPLLSTNLLFAFVIAAVISHQRVRRLEVVGALLVSGALGVFIAVGNPHSVPQSSPPASLVALSVGTVAAVVAIVIAIARRSNLATEAVLVATGAGLLYGMQDASTRAALTSYDAHGLAAVVVSPWLYILLVSATIGILLSQSAFRAARLDCSLPPTAVAEPICGIALGITVLGNVVSVTPIALATEAICLVAMIAGVILIGRSGAMSGLATIPQRPAHTR